MTAPRPDRHRSGTRTPLGGIASLLRAIMLILGLLDLVAACLLGLVEAAGASSTGTLRMIALVVTALLAVCGLLLLTLAVRLRTRVPRFGTAAAVVLSVMLNALALGIPDIGRLQTVVHSTGVVLGLITGIWLVMVAAERASDRTRGSLL